MGGGLIHGNDFRNIGIWLGLGIVNNVSFDEIIDENLKKYTDTINKDDLNNILTISNMLHNRHIPMEIKTSSIEQRIEFLEGYVDARGEVTD